jgi:hypothetical protein
MNRKQITVDSRHSTQTEAKYFKQQNTKTNNQNTQHQHYQTNIQQLSSNRDTTHHSTLDTFNNNRNQNIIQTNKHNKTKTYNTTAIKTQTTDTTTTSPTNTWNNTIHIETRIHHWTVFHSITLIVILIVNKLLKHSNNTISRYKQIIFIPFHQPIVNFIFRCSSLIVDIGH